MQSLWYPCTQMQHLESVPIVEITRAKGAYLYPKHGKPMLDMISSWWINIHGHANDSINRAIEQQLQQFAQVMLAGCTHQPIEQLSHQLVARTPPALQHCFFADSGSAAVEIALKMSVQYWQQSQEGQATTKRYFIGLSGGYHGETLGSLSVTDIPLFKQQYQPLLLQQLTACSPALVYKPADVSTQQWVQYCLDQVEQLLIEHKHVVSAIIVEPLVQGAAGMLMYPASYLVGLDVLCKQYQVHMIFDEIAVGFGRTGTLFAHEQVVDVNGNTICPDFLCLSKGLTAGYLPMSVVLTTHTVYQAFYSPDIAKGFLHSHSFTGNALAAAAANASLALFDQPELWQHMHNLQLAMHDGLQQIATLTCVQHPRQTGLIGACSLVNPHTQLPMTVSERAELVNTMQQAGYWLRPIGAHVYIIPPYCISTEALRGYWATLATVVEDIFKAASSAPSPATHVANNHSHVLP